MPGKTTIIFIPTYLSGHNKNLVPITLSNTFYKTKYKSFKKAKTNFAYYETNYVFILYIEQIRCKLNAYTASGSY